MFQRRRRVIMNVIKIIAWTRKQILLWIEMTTKKSFVATIHYWTQTARNWTRPISRRKKQKNEMKNETKSTQCNGKYWKRDGIAGVNRLLTRRLANYLFIRSFHNNNIGNDKRKTSRKYIFIRWFVALNVRLSTISRFDRFNWSDW